MKLDPEGVAQFFKTARERFTIRINRLAGKLPWTEDRVFKEWRFCNVHREFDRTTIWFNANVRSRVSGLQAIEATVMFRWFNKIETGELVKDLLINGWDTEEARKRLTGVSPLFTGAYMVNTPPGYTKLEGVLRSFEQGRTTLPRVLKTKTLQAAHNILYQLPRLGRFTAYEIVSDLRWTDVLYEAPDIMTWACAGVGCARGLGRVVSGNPGIFNYASTKQQGEMNRLMQQLLKLSQDPEHWPEGWRSWEMREVEHWLCEYDKYERAFEGEQLKRRYP